MADVYRGDLTPLQRHVAFFDRNKDGVIYPSETYQGTHARTVPSLHVLCYPRHGPVNYVILHVMTILIAAGFRAIGAGVPLAAAGAAFINGLLGPKTIPVYVVLHSLLLFFIYSRRSAFFLSQPCWPDHRYLQLWPSVL
jgi:peroxygenase